LRPAPKATAKDLRKRQAGISALHLPDTVPDDALTREALAWPTAGPVPGGSDPAPAGRALATTGIAPQPPRGVRSHQDRDDRDSHSPRETAMGKGNNSQKNDKKNKKPKQDKKK
jgi:hypothetical protein